MLFGGGCDRRRGIYSAAGQGKARRVPKSECRCLSRACWVRVMPTSCNATPKCKEPRRDKFRAIRSLANGGAARADGCGMEAGTASHRCRRRTKVEHRAYCTCQIFSRLNPRNRRNIMGYTKSVSSSFAVRPLGFCAAHAVPEPDRSRTALLFRMDHSWILLGLIGWALGLVVVLILLRIARNRERAARQEQERIDRGATKH